MRVLVTRPEPGASETADRLVAMGLEPVVLPLTRIQRLTVSEPNASCFDAVVVTSANAIRHAPESLLTRLRHLTCFAVGMETAKRAKDAGFGHVEVGGGDAVSLVELISVKLRSGSRLLYLCGRVRRTTFEPALAGTGIDVLALEIYDTLPMEYTASEVDVRVGSEAVKIAMIYSAEAAVAFLRLVASLAPASLAERPQMLCISPRVAEVLAAEAFEAHAAPEPSEASMLSTLRGMLSGRP